MMVVIFEAILRNFYFYSVSSFIYYSSFEKVEVQIASNYSLWVRLGLISINLYCGSDFWNFSRRSVFLVVDPDVFKKLFLCSLFTFLFSFSFFYRWSLVEVCQWSTYFYRWSTSWSLINPITLNYLNLSIVCYKNTNNKN